MRKVENLSGDLGGTKEKKIIRFELLGAFSYGEEGKQAHGAGAVKAGKKGPVFFTVSDRKPQALHLSGGTDREILDGKE